MKTRMTELFKIKYPIMCGGMMWLCKEELCAAISNAGALGNITAANYESGEALRKAIQNVKARTSNPFSVNITLMPSWRVGKDLHEAYFKACFEEKVMAIEITGAPVDKWLGQHIIDQAHKADTRLMHKVGSVRHAIHAEHVGYSAVIAAGIDEGGHPLNDNVGTMIITPRIAESVKIPVIATGGIADGRGLVAALALGADGIMMATRFINTTECVCHPKIKQQIIDRQEFETTIYGTTTQLQGRGLKNATVNQILEIESRHGTLDELQPLLTGQNQVKVWQEGDIDGAIVPVGQSIGLIHDVVSCKEVVERMMKEASDVMANLSSTFK